MARSFAPSLLVLATLIALVFPQLGLFAATLTHSEGQENVDTSLSTPTLTHEYDVFVSFRGEDTRTNFKAYLLAAFDRKRIRAYRDDKDLPRGREIGPELLKAIETSRIAVVVFSKNYATSSWCLDELVKIMECKRLLNQSVMPIFYEVSQSVVLEQKEIFAEALLNGPIDKVNNWRTALKEAANLEGFHLEPDSPEPDFIEEIVETIWKILYVESRTSTVPPCRQNDVPGQCSSLNIPQKGTLSGKMLLLSGPTLFFFF
ncbi:TMV resistance protein N-like isoform X1 [Quercus lobata]|uniref:TMV resistance protein N-like isoform X1 n=1 Tax=Quercus lobata TaxID=97700 RepID=UPI001245E08E|nr:TMV resistance protein N-like isoform X1 [Quercus lobata]